MKAKIEDKSDRPELECSEELQAKKQAIQNRQKRVLSDLSKTVNELKNGLYQLERLPED